MSEPSLPNPGDLIGVRYRIEELLGRGGMGAVFAAVNQATGRAVAIKWMLPGAARSQESLARFLSEARATAKIEHPNVIQILDVGQDGDAPFLVMERLRGESLAERLARGPLGMRQTLQEMIPACQGIAEAHSEGIIHRDLKPDNIFLCQGKDGSRRPPKVLDFGISKLYDQEAGPALTQTGIAMGTPQYMSPEQLNAPPDADARFDVYAMGIVLYECLTGQPPYRGDGLFELVQQIASGNPTPIRALDPQVPADLEAVVMRAMHVNREMRYATMESLVADLTQVQQRVQSGAPPPVPPTGPLSAPGAYTPAPVTSPQGGGGWTPASGYGGASAPGALPPTGAMPSGGWGHPPTGSAAGTVAPTGYGTAEPTKKSGVGLLIGAGVVVIGLGLLAVAGVGGAYLIFGGSGSSTAPTGGGTTPVFGGGNSPAADDPTDPDIDITFSDSCQPSFTGRRMVIASADSISVTSTNMAGLTGSIALSLNGQTGTVPISTNARIQNQVAINIMAGQQLWTNMAMDASGVIQGHTTDPISGQIVVTSFNSRSGVADLTFQNVTLQDMRAGTRCVLNGRLQTYGQTYGR
ncbi:MAG: serine/threonine protein kinase [Sandaracinaceae bacterium]